MRGVAGGGGLEKASAGVAVADHAVSAADAAGTARRRVSGRPWGAAGGGLDAHGATIPWGHATHSPPPSPRRPTHGVGGVGRARRVRGCCGGDA